MKKAIISYFCIVSILLININRISAQTVQPIPKHTPSGWTTRNPFHTDIFVENKGQFDNWAKSNLPISYAVNNADKIFFTKQGVVFKLIKQDSLSEEEREHQEHDKDKDKDKDKEEKIFYISMNWEGCNPNAEIKVSEASEGYYTFGEKGYENVKAKGYKKLLYNDLYPDIDVEYTIPDKGGIKYKIILHPNADPSLIKMHYSGAIEEINKDKTGNIIIETPAGDITDHAPNSYYETSKEAISSSLIIDNNTVSFQLQTPHSTLQTLIIDPWTTTPTSMQTNNAALDIGYDKYGNVFISGGTPPFKLSKYSNSGAFLWTFTNPDDWAFTGLEYGAEYFYSKFCVLYNSGTTYIGEGFSYNDGSRIMKINNDGTLNYTSPYFGDNNETWRMMFNDCSKQLIAFGGGTKTNDNIKIILDTNLSNYVSFCFDGVSSSYNDIASAIIDKNGDFYAIMTSESYLPSEGHLKKSLFLSNYLPPCAFNVKTYCQFWEGFYQQTVNVNALAINGNYVFGFNGKTIFAWNKTNGDLLNSIILDNNYSDDMWRKHEGIDVDECNNVYAGGANKIHVFSFDGNSFTPLTLITENISGEVQDIKLDRLNGILYSCGKGFATVTITPISCSISPYLTVAISKDPCLGNACVNATGGMPPYSYQWSNGSTDSCITNVPVGVYTIKIIDNSCEQNTIIDTVSFNSITHLTINPIICQGEVVNIGVHSYSTTGIYNDTLTTYLGCDSIITTNLTVVPLPVIDLGKDSILCSGMTLTFNVTYPNSIYKWQDNSKFPIYTASQEGVYWVKVTDTTANCSTTALITLECYLEPIIPNIITPNGDGFNDYFVIKNKEDWYVNLQILDRWGVKVYEDNNYQNNWDGKYKGNPLSDGVYYYIINAREKYCGKEKQYYGSLTILR